MARGGTGSVEAASNPLAMPVAGVAVGTTAATGAAVEAGVWQVEMGELPEKVAQTEAATWVVRTAVEIWGAAAAASSHHRKAPEGAEEASSAEVVRALVVWGRAEVEAETPDAAA